MIARDTKVAVRAARTAGPKACSAKLPTTTSSAKNTPASGALKLAAMAAATALASKIRRGVRSRRKSSAIAVPKVAPKCTIGPSRPTDAPAPMLRAFKMAPLIPVVKFIAPPRNALASITWAMPGGRGWPGKNSINSRPTVSPPATGPIKRRQKGCFSRPEARNSPDTPSHSCCAKSIA